MPVAMNEKIRQLRRSVKCSVSICFLKSSILPGQRDEDSMLNCILFSGDSNHISSSTKHQIENTYCKDLLSIQSLNRKNLTELKYFTKMTER